MTPKEKAQEIVKQFDYRSDCEMSLADRQWLAANIATSIQEERTHTDRYIRFLHEKEQRLAVVEEAMKLYREASYQSHNGHWDKTMSGGRGCPECIRSSELREKADHLVNANKMVPVSVHCHDKNQENNHGPHRL